jgi:hypothetical protein
MHFCADELRLLMFALLAAIPGYHCAKCFIKSFFPKKTANKKEAA